MSDQLNKVMYYTSHAKQLSTFRGDILMYLLKEHSDEHRNSVPAESMLLIHISCTFKKPYCRTF